LKIYCRQHAKRLRAARKISMAYKRYIIRTYVNLVYGTFKYTKVWLYLCGRPYYVNFFPRDVGRMPDLGKRLSWPLPKPQFRQTSLILQVKLKGYLTFWRYEFYPNAVFPNVIFLKKFSKFYFPAKKWKLKISRSDLNLSRGYCWGNLWRVRLVWSIISRKALAYLS